MPTSQRRYDLDWLRVIAILAVYFHHLGMPFNGDGFHIMNTESSKLLDDIMVYFEQFRLPLLFLISGTGTVFAFSKRTWQQFLKERSRRLLIPLFFGILFIVPPQTYYQYIDELSSYWQIYADGRFESNHLWFLEDLYLISIIVIPFVLYLRSEKSRGFIAWLEKATSHKMGFLLAGIPLIVLTLVINRFDSEGSSSFSEPTEILFYTYFFVSGILLASSHKLWENLKRYRRIHFVAFVMSSLLFYSYYFVPTNVIEPYLSLSVRWDIWYAVCAWLGWCFVMTLLGYGQIYLDKPSRWLSWMNEAIYPFYVLHQTVIVVYAYYIIQLDASIPSKMILLFIGSFFTIVLIYRFLVYPFRITRQLFGMKKQTQ